MKKSKNVTTFKVGLLEVRIFPDRDEMGKKAAENVSETIQSFLKDKDEINMIFAAAPSQSDFMKALIEDENIQWKRINAFHMDEYIGLEKDAPQGFGNFLRRHLFDQVPFKSVNFLNGQAENPEAECIRYSDLLENNPVDIVCLGIGENGHIAFNDPPVADFNDKKLVKVVELDEKCRQQQVNDGCFKTLDDVPKYALTLTIPALIAGKYLFCIVPGSTKTEAVTNTINGEISEACPASILRTHKNAILYVDKDSGKDIL